MIDVGSKQAEALLASAQGFMVFQTQSEWAIRGGSPATEGTDRPPLFDFVTGNPYEMPLPQLGEAVAKASAPQHKDWFAYTLSNGGARRAVADSLKEKLGLTVAEEDVQMTNGGFAAISVAMRAVADPGDEIIIITPCFFFYESMISAVGAVPVKVDSTRPDFDLDVDAIEAAITPRTKAVLINSPNNPGGLIYSKQVLDRLGQVLEDASQRFGHRIVLLSDEAFNRIVFDDIDFYSPTRSYPYSILLYTYGKTLLAPGMRLGYIAITNDMPEAARARLRDLMQMVQIAAGWLFPSSILQYSIPELEQFCIDVSALESNRNQLTAGLQSAGYQLRPTQGTFFQLVKSPIEDDHAFTKLLTRHDIFVLPGSIAYAPGHVRLSLGVRPEQIGESLPRFEKAFKEASS